MSEDLTKKLPKTDSEKISLILTTVQNLDTRTTHLENRFDALEQKVEERLYDTRPIWQKVVADIAQLQEGQAQLQEGQARLQEGQQRLESDVHEIKISMREIVYQIGGVAESFVKVQGKNRELEERVRDLERQGPKPTNSQT